MELIKVTYTADPIRVLLTNISGLEELSSSF